MEASVEGATICQRRAAALRSVSGRTGGLEREREGGMGGRDVPLSEMVEEDDSGRKQE